MTRTTISNRLLLAWILLLCVSKADGQVEEYKKHARDHGLDC